MADFQNNLIPIFGNETWPLAKIPEVAHTLFLPQGLEIELILALQTAMSEILADFQNFHIWAGIPEVAHILSVYPKWWKLSLFLLYGQRFPRNGPIFKIAIFGHETWQVAKVPEVANIQTFYPYVVKIELFFSLRAAVSEIRTNFQNCHI